MARLKVGIAQVNPVMGDVAGNAEKIIGAAEAAKWKGASLLVTPECALCGYPPDDLVYYDDFLLACRRGVEDVARRLPRGMTAVVGTVWRDGGRTYNAACAVTRGGIRHVYRKQVLPNYGVFDEKRYFAPGKGSLVFETGGARIGVLICEDIWESREPVQALAREDPDVVLVLNASPYYFGKEAIRLHWGAGAAGRLRSYLVYANMVGGQDEHVYDGASFVVDPECRFVKVMDAFAETVDVADLDLDGEMPEIALPSAPERAALRSALALGLRDYVEKTGFDGALVGLSGGIDSAVTLALAAEALGKGRVTAVMMPSRHTSRMSIDDSAELAANLGVRLITLPIEGAYAAMTAALAEEFADEEEGLTEENIQARIRGNLLMALSNKRGLIVLATGNKSELACGYCTLYGDMAGGFAVLKDVVKGMVYGLAEEYNLESEVIPRRIIERPPSAELRPDQVDQDTLPPYDLVDATVVALMERNEDHARIVKENGARAGEVLAALLRNEHKRRQAPPGITVTPRAFGKDWRMPICHRWRPLAG